MALIPDFYKNAVVSIGIKNDSGATNWIGTGFLVVRRVDKDGYIPFLVSNKHVFQGKKRIVFKMKELGSNNWVEVPANLSEADGSTKYVIHSNPAIDIAVLQLNGDFINRNNLEFPAFDIDKNAMSSSELLENGFDDGSFIYMLGFPMGLVVKGASRPICRMGCMARICSEQISETNNILIDIQNFPGNSGSPIISKPELVSITGTKNLSRSLLVGIVHSYISYNDTLRSSQSGEIVEIRKENSGLAYAHPVEYIREIIDLIQPTVQIEDSTTTA